MCACVSTLSKMCETSARTIQVQGHNIIYSGKGLHNIIVLSLIVLLRKHLVFTLCVSLHRHFIHLNDSCTCSYNYIM